MSVKRFNPSIEKGLSTSEVNARLKDGLVNYDNGPKTKTIKQIILSNFFTFFNLLNISLGIAVFLAGIICGEVLEGLKNCLFMGVIFINTLISITEEIISKKIIDKLSLLSESKALVIRNKIEEEKNIDELVLDDIIILKIGNQVVCDSIILNGTIEVNESFITGESEPITKKEGDLILSGSFVVSGTCYAKIEHIGNENYISKISNGAKYKSKSKSIIFNSFEEILKKISILIIPIGIVMFAKELNVSNFNFTSSVFGTVASLIGMIPEGLILLTSSVMAVSVIRLSKYKVLVQNLDGVESLARVDTICLDKTGTLTKGKMRLKNIIPYKKQDERNIEKILSSIVTNTTDENSTILSLKKKYNTKTNWILEDSIPFSSTRKFSAFKFKRHDVFYLGAPEILFKDSKVVSNYLKEYQKDYRVLVLAKNKEISENPHNLELIGAILIEDVIRKNAKKTIEYFENEGVKVKIISGDSLETILQISQKCGIKNLSGIDLTNVKDSEIKKIIKKYDIFARVSPKQKELIIESLQKEGHTVAMTGDGVNDVLALKKSDCGISLKSGSDSARNVSKLVLLSEDFDALPKVVEEGRRTINNIERSSSLLLVKTIYTILLIILSILFTTKYFFVPIQLTLITAFTIGIPSFILALEPNSDLVTGNFLKKILSKSLPVAFTVFINILMVTILKRPLHLSHDLTSTLSVFLTSAIGFIYLYRICTPFNSYRRILYSFLILGFILCSLIGHDFFNVSSISFETVMIFIILSICSIFIYKLLSYLSERIVTIHGKLS